MSELGKNINQIIETIRSYTNRAFLGGMYLKSTFTVTDGLFSPMLPDLVEGDIVEVIGSKYSNGFYVVNDVGVLDGEIRNETFTGYLVLIKPPLSLGTLNAMSTYITSVANNPAIRREQLGDTSFTLHSGSDLTYGMPATLMSSLKTWRQLPGGIGREYTNANINVKGTIR